MSYPLNEKNKLKNTEKNLQDENEKSKLLKFEKEVNVLSKIEKVREELHRKITLNKNKIFDDEIVELSQYLDKLLVEHMRDSGEKKWAMIKNNKNYKLNYENLIDMFPCALYVIRNSVIIDCNSAAVKMFGYDSKEELLGLKLHELSPDQQPDGSSSIEKGQEFIKNALSNEEETAFKWMHKRKNGDVFLADIKIYNKNEDLYNEEQREVEVCSSPVEMEERALLFALINDVSDKIHKELMFNTLFFNSPYAVVILDREQKIVNINKNFTHVFQYELDEAKGKYLNQLVSSSENKSQIDNNIQLIYQGEIVKQEGIRRRKDNKSIDVEILGYPVMSRDSIVGVYVIYNDISVKKVYEEQLVLFGKILENNSEGVVITDINGHIKWTNTAFEEITGYSSIEVKDRNMNILKSGIQDQAFYKGMWNQLENKGSWSGEVWNKTKKGEIYSEWLTINSIKDNSDKTTHYVGIFKDLSEKKKIDRRMAELQQKDMLTGLYNRDYFLELVSGYIKNCKSYEQFSIILIDIEGFKEINNSLGHHTGDKLLIELSKRLLLLMNDDCILSRYSGDEFAILCKLFTTENEIKSMAKTLLENIKQPFVIENTILNINANIGISRFPDHGKCAENLIRHAETAMYKAKEKLEEKICFYSGEMSKEIEKQFLLANLLVRAIPNYELTIYYQPIFDIKNPKNIMGSEALLRWENSVLGKLNPDKFIPLAEKTGHIIYIGEWVLEQVCKQIKLWQQTDCSILPVAVNISVKQLEQIKFVKRASEIIEKYNVKPSNIEMEITESISSGDLTTIVKNLRELKKYGIRISMDDFGTGFSSLGQLDLFELDKLKIDKIFIDGLLNVSKKQKLVKSIIAMARSLDLMVVAEGIETNEQLSYLKELGCQLGQGYLLSKPLPAKEIRMLFCSSKKHI